jgi:hypothetical protein
LPNDSCQVRREYDNISYTARYRKSVV